MASQDQSQGFRLFGRPISQAPSLGLSTAFDKVNFGLSNRSNNANTASQFLSYRDKPSAVVAPTPEPAPQAGTQENEFGGFFQIRRGHAPASQPMDLSQPLGGLEEELSEGLVMCTPLDQVQGQVPLSQITASQQMGMYATPAEAGGNGGGMCTQPNSGPRIDRDGFRMPDPPAKDQLNGKARRIQGSQPSFFGSQPGSQPPSSFNPAAHYFPDLSQRPLPTEDPLHLNLSAESPSPTPQPKRPRGVGSIANGTTNVLFGENSNRGGPGEAPGNLNERQFITAARPQAGAPVRPLQSPPCVVNTFLEKQRRRQQHQEGQDPEPDYDVASLTEQMSRMAKWIGSGAGSSLSVLRRQFKQLEFLGKGAYGCVIKAQHRIDGGLYAIKESSKEINSVGKCSEYLTEPRALKAVGYHPCIVQYFGSWAENKKIYIQMELCGENLAKLVTPTDDPLELMGSSQGSSLTPLSDAILCKLHDDLLSALLHMHSRGLAHMDLKPENVYVGEGLKIDLKNGQISTGGNFKLGDFGKCVELKFERNARGEEVCTAGSNFDSGDARYLAPELLDSSAHPDPRKADLFALGASLYELAKGSSLPSSGDAYQKIRKGQLMMLPGCSQSLVREIKTLMDPEPSKRTPRFLLKSSQQS